MKEVRGKEVREVKITVNITTVALVKAEKITILVLPQMEKLCPLPLQNTSGKYFFTSNYNLHRLHRYSKIDASTIQAFPDTFHYFSG